MCAGNCTVIDKNVAYDESNTFDAKWHYLVSIVFFIINELYFFAIVYTLRLCNIQNQIHQKVINYITLYPINLPTTWG